MDIDTSKIQEILGSDQVKQLLPYLLAGTGGAVLGGAMTGERNERAGESRTSHLGRILRNALLTGGLAAGSTALINKGLKHTTGAVDKANPLTGSSGNEGPASTALRGLAFSPLTAAAAGAGGLGATHGWAGVGAGKTTRQNNLELLASKLGIKGGATEVQAMKPDDLERLIASAPLKGGSTDMLDLIRSRAGVVYGGPDRFRRVMSRIANTGPMSTFGTTTGRRIGRGAMGLAMAGIPALAGAFLTNDPESN